MIIGNNGEITINRHTLYFCSELKVSWCTQKKVTGLSLRLSKVKLKFSVFQSKFKRKAPLSLGLS